MAFSSAPRSASRSAPPLGLSEPRSGESKAETSHEHVLPSRYPRDVRLVAIALVMAACGGRAVSERATRAAPAAEADPMQAWAELDPRGRDYLDKLASVPPERRDAMAIAFLKSGNLTCPSVAMSLPCGGIEQRMPAPLPSADLADPCLRRQIAVWALDQLDGASIARELPDVARALAGARAPELDFPRILIEKVEDTELLVELIGKANEAGHDELADRSIERVPRENLRRLATEFGVNAAFEAVALDLLDEDMDRREWRFLLRKLRLETRLRLIEIFASRLAASDPERRQAATYIVRLAADCPARVAAFDVLEPVAPQLAKGLAENGGWNGRACFALRREGPSSPAIRALVSDKGLRVERYSDHPNDDTEDRVWTLHEKNDDAFEMPYADELKEVLSACDDSECHVPGTTIRFRFTLSPDHRKLEAIERYERLGGC